MGVYGDGHIWYVISFNLGSLALYITILYTVKTVLYYIAAAYNRESFVGAGFLSKSLAPIV